MKKKSLRILSLIVAIVMVVAMLPLSALAEETGPKRKVGVVVYGAELTAVLTDIESALHGNVDLEASLKQIVDVATKVADGTGVSVPNVDVTLTDENGKSFKMEEDRSVEIFTDTTEMYIGFQEEVDKQLTKLESDLASLKTAMQESNKLTQALADQITEFEKALNDIRENLNNLKHTLVGAFNELKDPNGNPIVLNGILYRTYVTEEAVPANASYTVKVERFSDTDKDGNAITRDGYVLYNDGLESGGSKFNTYRSFSVDVKEQGRFDHEIQFVGPLAGIEGTLKLPDALALRQQSRLGDFVIFRVTKISHVIVGQTVGAGGQEAHDGMLPAQQISSTVAARQLFSSPTRVYSEATRQILCWIAAGRRAFSWAKSAAFSRAARPLLRPLIPI